MLVVVDWRSLMFFLNVRWSMRFNSMQSEEPYQDLTCRESSWKREVPLGTRNCLLGSIIASKGPGVGKIVLIMVLKENVWQFWKLRIQLILFFSCLFVFSLIDSYQSLLSSLIFGFEYSFYSYPQPLTDSPLIKSPTSLFFSLVLTR